MYNKYTCSGSHKICLSSNIHCYMRECVLAYVNGIRIDLVYSPDAAIELEGTPLNGVLE